MSIRRQIIAALSAGSRNAITTQSDVAHAEQLVDAYRAEVLNESADMVHGMADPRCTCGGCDSCAARGYAEELRRKARENGSREADATPAFFQPGHTYAWTVWRFHCATVTTHPQTGERNALGWLRLGDSEWTTYAYDAAEWGSDWVDVTEGGGS